MQLVQIIAGHAVRYSTNNGLTLSEFDDGVLYEVPDHVARGMLARNWARIVDRNELREDQIVDLPPLPRAEQNGGQP